MDLWLCGVADVGCATDELWSTPDHKRNEHDPKQRVGEVLPKFYLVLCLLVIYTNTSPFFFFLSLLYTDYISKDLHSMD